MFIVIEGVDGSGKCTQTDLLASHYIEKGIAVKTISFPAYDITDAGKMIAKYLNGGYGELETISPAFASTLYALDRYELRNNLIDAISKHKVVIADRYTTSNFAHQSAKLPIEKQAEFIDFIKDFEYNKLALPKPDKVFFLDMSINKTQDMILNKPKRTYTELKKDIHEKDRSYQERVLNAYKNIAVIEKWNIINCEDKNGNIRPKEDILADIIREIDI